MIQKKDAKNKKGDVEKKPVISVHNLHKSFPGMDVLCGIDLEIMPEQNLVIIGKSGTGKSVLIKSILGLIPPDDGRVIIGNRNVTFVPIHKRPSSIVMKVGMLFQGGALFDSLSIFENIVFGIRHGGKRMQCSYSQLRDIAAENLELVGLKPDIMDLYPEQVSGGMKKRVALARTIAPKPDIIFYDEPSTGLDPITARLISDLIVKCTKHLQSSSLVITHDAVCVSRVADKVMMLDEGKVVWQGTYKEMRNSENQLVKSFHA